MTDAECALIRRAFGCDGALSEVVIALARRSALARGQRLFPLDDRDETTLLTAGRAQEIAYGRDGGVLLLQLIGPGEFYGSLMGAGIGEGREDGPVSVEAASEGTAAHFATPGIVRLMEIHACIALAISRQLALRLEAMRRRMVETVLLSATGRICAELLRLAEAAGADRTIRPVPVLAELAVSVQSTRETVSRTISQLEKRGILSRGDGGLQVVAPHRLAELVY